MSSAIAASSCEARVGFGKEWQTEGGVVGLFKENVTRYRNAAFDRVVTAAERQLTLAARYAGYGEAEALLLRDVPLIPLWAGNSHRLVARRVRGWVDHPGHSHQSRYLSLAG